MTQSFSRSFALDAATGLIKRAPAQAAVTASAYIGSQLDQNASTATDFMLVVNIEAIDVASNDEVYVFSVIGSNASNRSDAELLGQVRVGKASAIGATLETRDAAAGDQIQLPFRSEKNRTKFRYVDLRLDVVGTTPSITFSAHLSKEI